jgi:hypothetical protein
MKITRISCKRGHPVRVRSVRGRPTGVQPEDGFLDVLVPPANDVSAPATTER